MLNVGDTSFRPCVKMQCFFIAYKVTVVPQWGEVRWGQRCQVTKYKYFITLLK